MHEHEFLIQELVSGHAEFELAEEPKPDSQKSAINLTNQGYSKTIG